MRVGQRDRPVAAQHRVLRAVVVCALLSIEAGAYTLTIDTVGGPVRIELSRVSPEGSLVAPSAPETPGFRPPSIFSAPLPSGSGARALGFAGAFTAVADDATAASWNPGALMNLERPEASVVLRYTHETDRHESDNEDFRVGRDEFSSCGLNYLSVALPFRLVKRNLVFAFNYQEAYDFRQKFTADLSLRSGETATSSRSAEYQETETQHVVDGNVEMDITTHLATRRTSTLRQILSSSLLTSLEFDQSGYMDALTPALAVDILPKLSIGGAVNVYQVGPVGEGVIRSRTRAHYEGVTESSVDIYNDDRTSGTYTYDGVAHLEPGGGIPIPIDVDISGEGEVPEFTESSRSSSRQTIYVEGDYEEENEFRDLRGVNGTLGALWTVSRHLSLGLTVDLPWTAEGEQEKTVRHRVKTYDESRTRLLNETYTEETETKDVEFHFPLCWSVGGVWRWNNRFATTLDLGETLWSDFYYKAEGGERLNPLDGTPHGENGVDDCWSVRGGAEFLWVMRKTELPFRAGFMWEQRPAIGSPDEYWGVSVGTGFSIGQDPGKLIVDIAYQYTWGNDVMGSLVPGQEGLSTDVEEHQVFVSSIWHF